MLSNFDARKLKAMAIEFWKRGGLDTLVKVCPLGTTPDPGRRTGYCTTFKFIVGRTPLEIEEIVGLARGSKLTIGADIFVVDPLPMPPQFELRGYSQCPAGIPTNAHPGYPPGLGAPQWELSGYPQSGLKLIASVPAGQRFTYQAARLPPRP
ncbi:MAG TPA: hypothetical protein VJX94_25655 [Stellaceae bacterium]|nr:hypothetical protein [Stellaceae bacterium]